MIEQYINTVHCMDSLEFMRKLPDKCVDLILTDPPYGLGKKLSQGGTWAKNKIYQKVPEWDIIIGKEYFVEIFRISKNAIIWGGNLYELPISRGWLSWNKNQIMDTMGDFELARTSFDEICKSFTSARNPDGKRQHPTQKPKELFKWCLDNYSNPGDIILDCFAGSGTTGVACIETGRKYILIEKEPVYVDIINKKIKNTNPPLFVI